MKKPWVILLSGTSCSGKTTLAHSLQECLYKSGQTFLHLEADKLIPDIPTYWIESESFSLSFSRAFRRTFSAYTNEGINIIVDGLLPFNDKME